MSQEELISYGIMAAGVLVTFFAAYKIVRKGIFFWLLLIIVGITAANYGYNHRGNVSLDGFLDNLNPGNLSDISKDRLHDLCDKINSNQYR